MEAQLIANVEAYKGHKCVHKLTEVSNIVHGSWLKYNDNQAIITISHDRGYTREAKHIELRLLAIQDIVIHDDIDQRIRPS